jgi:integrase
MTRIDRFQPSTAFVAPRTSMFSELLRRLEERHELTPVRRRDLASGLRRVAKALGSPPEVVPADPTWLRPRLERVAPASLGLSAKSWSNALSDVRAALVLFGCVRRRYNRKADLSPPWREQWDSVLTSGDRTLRPALSRFVYFLNSLDIPPENVSDEHVAAYRDALAADEIRKSPTEVYRNAILAWNLAGKRISGWPQQRLSLPSRTNRIKLPIDTFPASFRADLDRFIASLECPDPLDPDALMAPLRPETIRTYVRELVRFASALIHAGTAIGEIEDLAAVVAPDRAKRGLRWLLDRNGGKPSPAIAEIAALLKVVARRFVRVSHADQRDLDQLARRLARKKPQGMTAKNRERLRPLQDPQTLRRLLALPEQLFRRAQAMGDTQVAALQREDAIAIAILLTCPIRRHNLSKIHLERTLHRPGDGRVFLVCTADEVKNTQHIEFELPPETIRMIDHHVAARSPRLCPLATPWLFPRRDGSGPVHNDSLSKRIRTRIRREIGLTINPHLFRHLAAMLWLNAHPGAYEAARRLLGHSRLSSTLNQYTGLETATAARLFAEVIDARRVE